LKNLSSKIGSKSAKEENKTAHWFRWNMGTEVKTKRNLTILVSLLLLELTLFLSTFGMLTYVVTESHRVHLSEILLKKRSHP
jgi:hypothetical protein